MRDINICTKKKGGMLCRTSHALIELVTQVLFSFVVHILYVVTKDNCIVELLIDTSRKNMRTKKTVIKKKNDMKKVTNIRRSINYISVLYHLYSLV